MPRPCILDHFAINRICFDCREDLPIEDFPLDRKYSNTPKAGRRSGICKICASYKYKERRQVADQKYRQNHKKKIRKKRAKAQKKSVQKRWNLNRCRQCDVKFSQIYGNRRNIIKRPFCLRCYIRVWLYNQFIYTGRHPGLRESQQYLLSPTGMMRLIEKMPKQFAMRYPNSLLSRTVPMRKAMELSFDIDNLIWRPSFSSRAGINKIL